VKFKIKIDGAQHEVDAAADGTVVIDGLGLQTKIAGSGGDKRTVQVGDSTFEIRVFRRGDPEAGDSSEYVLEVAGERVSLSVADVVKGVSASEPTAAAVGSLGSMAEPAARPPSTAAETSTEVKDGIWAPVPGKIIDVRVKAGDSVKEGDLVVILEAMKMENELHASKQATVASVPIKKGDQVEKGQLLVAFD
jgi:biotin carboxyl carrier protein